jgi:hypothetical protein
LIATSSDTIPLHGDAAWCSTLQRRYSQVRPWVHYVPLATNLTDVVSTVAWLIAHDADAQRIAQQSSDWIRRYLRLEVMSL